MHSAFRYAVGVALVVAVLTPALGQDTSGQYYKKPETAEEFWRYMNHEIELGDYKIAAGYLKGFLGKNPSDEELLKIQEREGSAAFLRLLTIPELKEDARPLADRVDAIVLKHLSDRKRLDALIKNLYGDKEERDYALSQLRRSGAAAMPALIDALIATANDYTEHAAILTALVRLDKAIVPPLVAALSVNDANLRAELIGVLRQRGSVEAAPDLWYLSASPQQPPAIRKRATDTLIAFLNVPPDRLPPARVALTEQAERYYQHQIHFSDPSAVTIWSWDGRQLVSQTVSASQAEEHWGLHYARQTLDLDPDYLPAQIIFLSVALDKGMHKGGLDQPLSKESPAVRELLTSVNPELLIATLDKALKENRVSVVLGSVQALGDLAEKRALQAPNGQAPVLLRALDYPDRRVQMAAADAILRIPAAPGPQVGSRVVEVLRRMLAGEADTGGAAARSRPVALVAFADDQLEASARKALADAGYDSVIARSGREVLQRLARAADIDLLIMDSAVANPRFPDVLGQIASDTNYGRLPILLVAPSGSEPALRSIADRFNGETVRLDASHELADRYRKSGQLDLADQENRATARIQHNLEAIEASYSTESGRVAGALERQLESYRNVRIIPLHYSEGTKRLKPLLQAAFSEAGSPPLSAGEKKDFAARALEWLVRLGRGEGPGYDIRPAGPAILAALRSKELAGLAIEGAGRLPGAEPQRALATLLLKNDQPESLRSATAIELCRHIQQNGTLLLPAQLQGVQALYASLPDGKLKANVSLVLGSFHPDARTTSERLERYRPVLGSAPAKAPPPAPAADKEEKEKGE
jgi:CheY-like chemotaxis protein